MKYRKVAQKLTDLGCEEIPRRSGGSHRKWLNPVSNKVAPVPDREKQRSEIGQHFAQIIRQLELNWDEFTRA